MTRLAVLRRSIVDRRGRERVERLVACPAGWRCVPVAACERCGLSRGEFADDETGEYELECASEVALDPREASFRTQVRVVPVLAVASRSVIGVAPDATAEQVRLAMDRGAIGCVVVMDRLGVPLGIVTPSDLLDGPEARTAAEVMKTGVITVRPMTPVTRAAAVMAYEGIHHLPIVNDAGEVIAVLSSLDVLRHLAREGGFMVSNVSVRGRQAEDEDRPT